MLQKIKKKETLILKFVTEKQKNNERIEEISVKRIKKDNKQGR